MLALGVLLALLRERHDLGVKIKVSGQLNSE